MQKPNNNQSYTKFVYIVLIRHVLKELGLIKSLHIYILIFFCFLLGIFEYIWISQEYTLLNNFFFYLRFYMYINPELRQVLLIPFIFNQLANIWLKWWYECELWQTSPKISWTVALNISFKLIWGSRFGSQDRYVMFVYVSLQNMTV